MLADDSDLVFQHLSQIGVNHNISSTYNEWPLIIRENHRPIFIGLGIRRVTKCVHEVRMVLFQEEVEACGTVCGPRIGVNRLSQRVQYHVRRTPWDRHSLSTLVDVLPCLLGAQLHEHLLHVVAVATCGCREDRGCIQDVLEVVLRLGREVEVPDVPKSHLLPVGVDVRTQGITHASDAFLGSRTAAGQFPDTLREEGLWVGVEVLQTLQDRAVLRHSSLHPLRLCENLQGGVDSSSLLVAVVLLQRQRPVGTQGLHSGEHLLGLGAVRQHTLIMLLLPFL